jgi:hypothetical protein
VYLYVLVCVNSSALIRLLMYRCIAYLALGANPSHPSLGKLCCAWQERRNLRRGSGKGGGDFVEPSYLCVCIGVSYFAYSGTEIQRYRGAEVILLSLDTSCCSWSRSEVSRPSSICTSASLRSPPLPPPLPPPLSPLLSPLGLDEAPPIAAAAASTADDSDAADAAHYYSVY